MTADPLSPALVGELEELKLRLIAMRPTDLSREQASAMAAEIGAIRLHLKRLALEREDIGAMMHEAVHGQGGRTDDV